MAPPPASHGVWSRKCSQSTDTQTNALFFQVTRLGATGEDIRSKLTLQAASTDGAGVALALRDIDVSTETAAPAWVRGNAGVPTTPPPPRATASAVLPLARVTRVRCLAGSTGGESLGFVVLAVEETSHAGGRREARSKSGDVQPLPDEEIQPFGVLRATSGEDFHALVLGVASVK